MTDRDKDRSGTGDIPALLTPAVARWYDKLGDAASGKRGPLATGTPASDRLIRLVASSEYAAGVLGREWEWFASALAARGIDGPAPATLDPEMDILSDDESVKAALRQFRHREMLRILWRAIDRTDDVWSTLESLSDLADTLIEFCMRYAEASLRQRFGSVVDADGRTVSPVVLAMGKLGGRELNFSSDVDLIFLYTRDGHSDGERQLSAHEYYGRFVRQVVNLLDETTRDGFVYRVDARLRPFGDSGPPVVSFNALETYLVQHGRSWERYAYIKARALAPTATADDIDELNATIIKPFVYRRYLDYGVFESLRDMKALIEAEVRKRELRDNVKLGPGGIREIEFIVQSLQLVRGGADSQLQQPGLRAALSRLGHDRALGDDAVRELIAAYEFLRSLENALQAIRDQQVHELPTQPEDQARLALALGYTDWQTLTTDLDVHRTTVSGHFDSIAFRRDEDGAGADHEPVGHWTDGDSIDERTTTLSAIGIAEPDVVAGELERFASSSLLRQVDTTARRRLNRFMDTFVQSLKHRDDPAVVCRRVLSVVAQIARRSAYVAMLNENPIVRERLTDLCGQSDYLATEIARYPLLLDELLDPRLYARTISRDDMEADLDQRLSLVDAGDSESAIEALARFQRATLFRIAVSDISGKLPIMKVSDALTALAEVVLDRALSIAWSDLSGTHGEPQYEFDGVVTPAGFGVIGYGKLGGIELSYGSDLDLVFLHDSTIAGQTDGPRPLDNSMFFGRLVRRLVHFLTTQTSSGVLYEVDTRLRPSGRSGLLVVTTEGFEKYQEENAWTWEHQALLRSRSVAGSASIADAFARIRRETLRHRVRRESLLDDVLEMRARMRERLDKSGDDAFDLKQGEGGIGDIEFLVQYLVLKHAGSEPSLVDWSDNIRQLDALANTGLLPADDVSALQSVYRALRHCSHRLTLDGQPAIVSPGEFSDERALVMAIWQREMT
jgi:glutamate-ammonia-ligase adenylyltransferase